MYNSNDLNDSPSAIVAIRVVDKPNEVDEAVALIREKCESFPVIGIDCEWNATRTKKEQAVVALLQIATKDGFCVLIRTCKLEKLPTSLIQLLDDRNILKVGVAVYNDGEVLHQKYNNVKVNGRFDLRFLSRGCNIYSKNETLKELAKSVVEVDLQKDNVLSYNWTKPRLDAEETYYAALDALVGVLIFDRLLPLYHEQVSNIPFQYLSDEEVIGFLHSHFFKGDWSKSIDKRFK